MYMSSFQPQKNFKEYKQETAAYSKEKINQQNCPWKIPSGGFSKDKDFRTALLKKFEELKMCRKLGELYMNEMEVSIKENPPPPKKKKFRS